MDEIPEIQIPELNVVVDLPEVAIPDVPPVTLELGVPVMVASRCCLVRKVQQCTFSADDMDSWKKVHEALANSACLG